MEVFEWNVLHEGQLLDAMMGHKPVGINKYFQMACICDKFNDSCQKNVVSETIWSHLGTMYNLEVLDESESIPFPNIERDFSLPESDFGPFLIKKDEDKKTPQKGYETPKNLKEIKKDDKTPMRNVKDLQRRDSRDSKEKLPGGAKKEIKKDAERSKPKGKNTSSGAKDESKAKVKDDTPKPAKRPTRGSFKPDDSSSSGKSSPVNVGQPPPKRRRI